MDLFLTFCKIGGLTFGGGYAMLPMLQREVVEGRQWATEAEIMDYYAIGQCLPGLIAVNVAVFTGNKVRGPLGGICAALGVVFPSMIVITAIAAFLTSFAELAAVQSAFAGIRVCVLVLIANAIMKLRKASLVDWRTTALFAAVFLLSILTKISPIAYVVAAALLGALIQYFAARGRQTS
ncbi:MAG: chromate transporter [Oscillospiraceae bacterium]|nr:chromate transporter [Oscillospiraceae bacterium]